MSASEVQRGSSTLESSLPQNGHTFGPGRTLRPSAKVLPEHARGHNRALVLQTLYHQGAMSRADLSRETGLTRVTISDLVAELMADALVVEKGMREITRPGKPAILVDIDREAHHIIGLDLSGAELFIGAIMTLDGRIVERRSLARPHGERAGDRPAENPDVAANIAAVVELAKQLVAATDTPVLGVGVGTPGIVNDAGTVLAAPNFGWVDIDLEGILREALQLPVIVANDANAAVLAEYTFGGAGEDVLLVKIGRGVGSGLLAGGQPMRGSHFAAGEIGHVIVGTDGGPLCVCGNEGCLEAWLAVPALSARLAAASDDAAREGVLRDAGARLGIALAPVIGALDLSEIILSGPPELLDGPLAAQAVETLRTRTLAQFHDGVRVRMTAQGQDIVLRGAAVMVLSGQLGVS